MTAFAERVVHVDSHIAAQVVRTGFLARRIPCTHYRPQRIFTQYIIAFALWPNDLIAENRPQTNTNTRSSTAVV